MLNAKKKISSTISAKKKKLVVMSKTEIRLLLLLVFILFIVMSIAVPIISHGATYRWWSKYDTKGKYDSFSLTSLAFFESNALMYGIYNLFTPINKQFTHTWWVYFITGFMKGAPKGIVKDGFVTPKSLCESLIPDTIPHNEYNGKRAWPTTVSGWQDAIKEWGGITWNGGEYKWNGGKWDKDKDNFLRQWGISPSCNLIVGFITNADKSPIDQSILWGNDLLQPLLGIKTGISSGGWFGFLQHGDNFNGRGLSEANRLIWSNEIPKNLSPVIKKQKTTSHCNPSSITSGALGLGMGGGFAMAALSLTNPVGWILGGIFVGATTGGLLAAGSTGCI